jgi:protein TonB
VARRRRRAAAAARYREVPKLARPDLQSRAALIGSGLVGSALFHAALLFLILSWKPRSVSVEPATAVEIAVVEREKPPPPPEPPKVEEKKPEPPPKAVRPRAKLLPPPPKEAPPPPQELKEDLPPPPNEPPEEAKPQAPVMIGISMSSTTSGGGFAAPVGNSLYGSAPKVAPKPEDVRSYASPAGRYVPPYKVAELPVVLVEVKAQYPAEARKLGLEGQVVLRVTVDATGKVSSAKVIKGIGNGFDESALEAMRRFKFKPGIDAGEAIITEITYTMTFLLD